MVSSKVNNCRDIIPYVPPIVFAQTTIEQRLAPQNLTNRKRKLGKTVVIGCKPVNFIIVPSQGDQFNTYTVKLNKNGEVPSEPYGLNKKYHDKLHGWQAEKRKRPNGHFDTFYYHENKSSECRSVVDVSKYVLNGFDRLKVEIDPVTNAVKELPVETPERQSNKRKIESLDSMSEPAAKKRKVRTSQLHVEGDVAARDQEADGKMLNGGNQHYLTREFLIGEPVVESSLTPERRQNLKNLLYEARNNLLNWKPKHFNPEGSKENTKRKRFGKTSFSNTTKDSREDVPQKKVNKEKGKDDAASEGFCDKGKCENVEATVSLANTNKLPHTDQVIENEVNREKEEAKTVEEKGRKTIEGNIDELATGFSLIKENNKIVEYMYEDELAVSVANMHVDHNVTLLHENASFPPCNSYNYCF